MDFTVEEVAVLEVFHKFTTQVFKRKLVGMHETLLNGFTMADALKYIFKKRGLQTPYTVVVDKMLRMQWLVFVTDVNYPNGRWGLNTLCTCGRCCKYVQRGKVKSLGNSEEGKMYAFFREYLSGKDLNWNSQPYVAEPTPVDNVRRAKARDSKIVKAKTPQRSAKVWNECNGSLLKEEFNKKQRLLKILKNATFELMEMQ